MPKISMTVNSCEECPYLEYNPYYDRAQDSGYDCKLANRRVADDSKLVEYSRVYNEWKRVNKMFPGEEPPENPLSNIPEWCPLR